jgi:hypothetical protein
MKKLIPLIAIFALFMNADFAQSATQMVNPKIQFDDDDGEPCSGCKVFFYETGTATKQATYTDAGGGTPNSNPVVLDSAGQASIWLNEGDQYRVILAPSTDSDPPVSPIWTVDNVDSIQTLTIANDSIFLVQHTSAGYHSYRLLSEFTDLADAVVTLGATDTELRLNSSDSSSTTVPDNITVRPIIGYVMSGTVTWNGPIVGEPMFQWLSGANHTLTGAKVRGVPVEWFGAVADGSTDNSTAINNCLAAVHNSTADGSGKILFGRGTYKFGSTIELDEGTTVQGASEFDTVLWYSGTTSALNTISHGVVMKNFHLTSLDPSTTGWMTQNQAGTGTGQTGILIESVQCKIQNCRISYFNKSTSGSEGIAIKTNGSNCFSGLVENCYIRFCYGGISLEDTVTDWSITDTQILYTTKFNVSIGYDWNAGSQTSFTCIGTRITNCVLEEVNHEGNEAATGDGYLIYISNAANTTIARTHLESYYAGSGATAYGIYMNGVSADKLFQTTIQNCNIATPYSGTRYPIWADYATYGTISNNYLDSGTDVIYFNSSNVEYFLLGPNMFLGGPADPYSGIALGVNCVAVDLLNRNIDANSALQLTENFGVDLNLKLKNRVAFADVLSIPNGEPTPNVYNGNILKTANTGATTITSFDFGSQGQLIWVIFGDANTTVDFTGTNLYGNGGADWSPGLNDSMTCVYDGTNWYCDISDN